MKEKRWSISLISAITVTLAAFALLMAFADPLLRYRPENKHLTYYEYTEIYANPGIARQYQYDAVLVGTSMVQNTDVAECNETFSCNMVKLPYSGGTSYNMKTILDICFDSGNDIKTVYWGLDEFQLQDSAVEPRYPLPDYLYSSNHKDDVSYLLNMDIFYHYTLNNVIGTLRGETQSLMRGGERFSGDFSKEAMMDTYSRPEQETQVTSFEDMRTMVEANLFKNIVPLIEEHADTEFVFFMVPFSVLYWDKELRMNQFDATMDAVEFAMQTLLSYENVRFYFYQNETDIITNLDNYKDYTHYGPWVNSFMVQSIASGYGEVTATTYRDVIKKMRNDMRAYDFEALF